jgi:dTDP-4-dehydrorhamnose reductase
LSKTTRNFDTLGLPATRPLNSRLNNDLLEQTFGLRLQDWRAALALCVDEMHV